MAPSPPSCQCNPKICNYFTEVIVKILPAAPHESSLLQIPTFSEIVLFISFPSSRYTQTVLRRAHRTEKTPKTASVRLFATKYSVRWPIPWIPHDIIVNETMMSTMNCNRTLNCIFICVSNHFTIWACWRKMKMGTITTFHILNATIFESSISDIIYTTLYEF